jgi:FkbM family methyltransferase
MMMMRASPRRIRPALLSALFVFGACSGEPADPASPEDAAAANSTAVAGAIAKHRERFRSAPGRRGILAEEPVYSLAGEEVIIRHFFQDRRDGFFLDVGCAWPINASNTYYPEKHLGWNGFGVDALSDYAEGWAKERPRSSFFNYLVTDRSGPGGRFFRSPGLGLSSTNRVVASGKWFGPVMETTEIQVPMTTLDDLLDREGIEKVDLVSMDIEGHEPKALAGFDIDRFQPELLVIEGHSEAVTRYLVRHGYEQILSYVPFDRLNRYFRRKPTPGPR